MSERETVSEVTEVLSCDARFPWLGRRTKLCRLTNRSSGQLRGARCFCCRRDWVFSRGYDVIETGTLQVKDAQEAARAYLTERGCTVLRWEGAGKACVIEDPFGIRFNLWQELPQE